MSSPLRQDPWSQMPRLQDEINRLFGNTEQSAGTSTAATWVPPVDIYEYPDRFEFYVDLPGIDPGKVELTLQGGVLTLFGERNEPHDGKPADEAEYLRSERGVGRFYRRFVLPDTVDSDKVNASGKLGVLTLTIPKRAKAVPRKIQIAA